MSRSASWGTTTCKTKPYLAKLRRGGKHVHLGSFATAEEAALAFARSSAAHAASSRKRKAEPEEEQEDAEDDDVEVVVLDAYELFELPVAMGAARAQEDHSEAQYELGSPLLAFAVE